MLNNLGRSTFKAEFAFPPATHGADLSYYFNGGKFAEGVNVDAATAFAQSFMNFVKHLNPSVQDTLSNISLAKWKPWTGGNEMVFNQTSTGAADVRPVSTSTDLLTRCRLWESLSHSTSRKSKLALAFPFAIAFAFSDAENTTTPVVDLGYAKYRGTIMKDKVTGSINSQFLAIRFAAPPTGTSRFAAPKPPLNTPAVQLAYTEPPFCYLASPWGLSDTNPFSRSGTALPLTPETGDFDPQSSENCLFLNVVTPGKLGEKKNLPVVVWIYGYFDGGYTAGSASDSGIGILFDGNDLVRASGGEVVALAIQYRAGLFGFLAGQKVKEGGALNAGLFNQQFALQWVQKHIAKFGGDPRKVTIWGESAGAGSVLQHIVANGGKTKPSLSRAATTSSTFLPSQYQYNSRIPELHQPGFE
ncbi:alpha/beta-hydrolase [Agrocybe pediades]|nr:alpha/beta-hydrolase [Agrocybe pediades]